jgi:hypothetical protein
MPGLMRMRSCWVTATVHCVFSTFVRWTSASSCFTTRTSSRLEMWSSIRSVGTCSPSETRALASGALTPSASRKIQFTWDIKLDATTDILYAVYLTMIQIVYQKCSLMRMWTTNSPAALCLLVADSTAFSERLILAAFSPYMVILSFFLFIF